VRAGGADAPAALNHIVHQLEQGSKLKFVQAGFSVIFISISE
jgi:hypothetical protein